MKVLSFILFPLLFAACEGDPGQPGASSLPDDLYPPTVELILPLPTRPIYGQSIVEAVIADDDTIESVEFLVDGVTATDHFTLRRPLAQYYWNNDDLQNGRHNLQLRARDRSGKVGQSSLLFIEKREQVGSLRDTMRFYADDTITTQTAWKFPPDSGADYSGIAVRFSPDRACQIKGFGFKVLLRTGWTGRWISLTCMSEKDGLPDTVIFQRQVQIRSSTGGNGDVTGLEDVSFRTGVPINGEFFALVKNFQSDTTASDTFAILSDNGGWINGHGIIQTTSGEWKPMLTTRGRRPNPLIYAAALYP